VEACSDSHTATSTPETEIFTNQKYIVIFSETKEGEDGILLRNKSNALRGLRDIHHEHKLGRTGEDILQITVK
jgi:hypothetical protein